MKIYVSLPISGHDIDRCRERAARAKAMVERKGHTAITPFDVCPEQGLEYAEYVSRDVKAVMGCDAVLMLMHWHRSPRCRIEYHTAETYTKQVYLCLNAVPDINDDEDEAR